MMDDLYEWGEKMNRMNESDKLAWQMSGMNEDDRWVGWMSRIND